MRRRAFTLIELLVVVAIIGLLIAIMIPSLARARKQAKTTVCMTNERALSNALRTYIQLWGTTIYGAGHGAIYGAWDYQLLGENLAQATYYTNNARRDATDKIRYCPETTQGRWASSTQVGTVSQPWDCKYGVGGGSTGSYGFNNWLYRPETVPAAASSTDFYPISKLTQNDSTIPVFADCIWHDFLARPTDMPGASIQDPEAGTPNDRNLADVCIDRHSRAVNVSFFDDHVETVKLGDLWKLRWSATWTRGTPMTIH